jgi:hypothetical protein
VSRDLSYLPALLAGLGIGVVAAAGTELLVRRRAVSET